MPLNFSTYVFGKLLSGNTQFPNDSASNQIFEYIGNRIKAESQLYIHRDNDLIYYAYLRRLSTGKYIGLCTVFNGVYITDLAKVLSIFEEAIDYCAIYGYLIKPKEDDPSTYEPNSSKLYLSKDDVEKISTRLTLEFSSLSSSASLPAIDYGISDNTVFEYNYDSIDATMAAFVSTKPHTFIYKDENFFSERAQGLIGAISRLNKEKDELEYENKELQKEYNALKRKQKNYYWIWGFSILAIIFMAYLWNTVFFPSEVTNKDMGEYNYYGEMQNGKPWGKGVAFFKDDDKNGYFYYVGQFRDGEPNDANGFLYMKDGDFYRGVMYKQNSKKFYISDAVYMNPIDNCYYNGTFGKPHNGDSLVEKDGIWYDLIPRYKVQNFRVTTQWHYKYYKVN